MGEGFGQGVAKVVLALVFKPSATRKGARVCPFTSDETVVFMAFIPDCALDTAGLGEGSVCTKI